MVTHYEDFYLHVGWPDERGRFPIHVVHSPCGETRQWVLQENKLRLPACQHVLDYLEELIAEPEEVELLGQSLHAFLFPTEVDEIFRRCRQDMTRGLRVRLRIDPEELSLLPWEYCYDPKTRQYLALERQTPIVRYIAEGFAAPTTLTMPQPVKLLVVLAAPKDQPELDMTREEAGIRQALQNVPVELVVLRHATVEKLHDALLNVQPHILHFSGHGVTDNGVGALALEDPALGNTAPLTARQMRSLLNRMGITLAVLNACETARHSTRDALMGVAQAMIREEIPAVIAMQFLVSETVALMFTRRMSWGEVKLRDEDDRPNQGIIDSGRNGVIVAAGGIVVGLIFGLAIGVPCYFGIGFKASTGNCVSGELSSLLSGLRFGLGLGAILGLIAGQILGGFAWLRHHLTRSLLYLNHRQIPWRLEEYLTYATKLNLLRRVGGGFEFIDQDLQAYFEKSPSEPLVA